MSAFVTAVILWPPIAGRTSFLKIRLTSAVHLDSAGA